MVNVGICTPAAFSVSSTELSTVSGVLSGLAGTWSLTWLIRSVSVPTSWFWSFSWSTWSFVRFSLAWFDDAKTIMIISVRSMPAMSTPSALPACCAVCRTLSPTVTLLISSSVCETIGGTSAIVSPDSSRPAAIASALAIFSCCTPSSCSWRPVLR